MQAAASNNQMLLMCSPRISAIPPRQKAAVAAMTSGGRILLTSSVSARIGIYQHTLYGASKAAVSAMVLNLAPELAERGIAINAIAPGGTATDMAAEVGALYIPPALRTAPAEAAFG